MDFYEFLPPRCSCEDLLIERIKSYPLPICDMVDHPHNFQLFPIPLLGLNPLTPKSAQNKNLRQVPNFILENTYIQIAPCESTIKEISFEWSHHRISSTDSKVRTTLNVSITDSKSERIQTLFHALKPAK